MFTTCQVEPFHDLDGVVVEQDALLANYCTFRLGGACSCVITCYTPDALTLVVHELQRQNAGYVLLGGGSNVLISDGGVDTVIVRYISQTIHCDLHGNHVTISAAASLDALAQFCASKGLEGLTCCTGIPGTVGGAIVGNVGAWGEQISDVLTSVTLMSREGHTKDVSPLSLEFGYRWSRLKVSDDIVIRATFCLNPGNANKLLEHRSEILRLRSEKHPCLDVDPCVGSIFKNIEPTSVAGCRQAAGWFLEQAGVHGMTVGGAEIFEKHANIIVKRRKCTAQDVYELMNRMRQAVQERFGIELEREIRLLGRFAGSNVSSMDFY